MIPETLEGWTLGTVRALVEQGVFETDRFDFKEKLPHPKDEDGKRRLRRDIAAFANSDGGFLIFGVKDDKGLAASDRLVGVPGTDDFPVHFGNYASASEPSVPWAFKNDPPIALGKGRAIHVVHIPHSPRRPHGVFEDGRWWFCKRTNKGTEALSYGEVQAIFLARREKLAKLRFFRSEVEHVRDVAKFVSTHAGHPRGAEWKHPIPSFSLASAVALLPELFELFGDNDALVKSLQSLRETVLAADSIRTTTWLNAKVVGYQLRHAGEGLLRVADIALPLLKKVEADVQR